MNDARTNESTRREISFFEQADVAFHVSRRSGNLRPAPRTLAVQLGMQLQLGCWERARPCMRFVFVMLRRDDGMNYTTCILTTKAVVEGMISKAGLAGNPCEAPLPAAFVSAGAAPVSERAQLPAERSEERRLLLAGHRACARPKACGGTIVTRPSFGALGAAPRASLPPA